jgi:hypothetical protein
VSLLLEYTPAALDLSQLHDELLGAALPPERVAASADGATAYLTMPDGTSEPAVAAVVAAHVPRVRYDPAALLAQRAPALRENRRAALLVRAAKAATVAELRDVLVAHLREGEAT